MRVGLDYHPAVTHAPGVGRYARELVRALVRLDEPGFELGLADVGRDRPTLVEPALGLADAPHPPRRVVSRQGRRLFSLLGRSADGILGGVDLFHRMLPDWPPVKRARELIAVAELPPAGSPVDGALRGVLARAEVLVFSAQTAATLTADYGVEAERIHPVPVGCDHWCRDLGAEPVPRRSPPQVVVLGSLHPRRRPERVLRALEVLKRRRRECHLLYVGARSDHADAFLRDALGGSIARDWVLWNSNAAEADMARILAGSSAMVHLTEGEETAVTPLEGLAFGMPVVASAIPPFEEALGDAARLVTPEEEEDPTALAEALDQALAESDDEDAQARRRAVAARFTWQANAEATAAVYRSLA